MVRSMAIARRSGGSSESPCAVSARERFSFTQIVGSITSEKLIAPRPTNAKPRSGSRCASAPSRSGLLTRPWMRTCVETAVFIVSAQYGRGRMVSTRRSTSMACRLQCYRGCRESGMDKTLRRGQGTENQSLGACKLQAGHVACANCTTGACAISRDFHSPTGRSTTRPRARRATLPQPTEAPFMIRRNSIACISAVAVLLVATWRAEAAAFGPDMPAWMSPAAERAAEKTMVPPAEPAPDANVPDPLDSIRASVAKAEDQVQSDHPSDALSTIESALNALDQVPQSQPGAAALRDELGELKDRCEKQNAAEASLGADDGSDGEGSTMPKLRSIKPERNERVDKWIDFYTGRGRDQFQLWLVRSGSYMDLLARNLRAEGVPEELANLVFVESGFNMQARSMARAVGPWQFIRGTAKIFGLKMTPYVDQRRDPELATRAAARYLRKLYDMFDGSWPLALAAFNSGEGTIRRAIRRQKTDDYWALRLPRETRDYVPQFLAAMEIANDPEHYGFDLPPNSPFRFDEVLLRGPVDLKLVSGITAIPFDELQNLNPMFVRHRAPAGQDGTSIRVPKGKGDEVQELLQTYYKPKPLSNAELRDASRAQQKELRRVPRHRGSRHVHLVKRGETLSQIGQRYGKAPSTLARLNRINDQGQLRAGQRIRIQ